MTSRRRQIEELRGLLAKPPSRALFRALLRQIQRWGGDLSQAPLEYAVGIVSRWPGSVHRPMPPKWVDLAMRGRAPRAARLCAHLDLSSRALDDALATTLAKQPSLSNLSSLRLCGDESALRAFLTRSTLRSLRRLEFDGALTDGSVIDLFEDPVTAGLRVFVLGEGFLTRVAAEAIASSHAAASLERVALPHNPLGDAGVCALIEGEALPHLTRLDVSGCGVSLASVHVLAGSPARRRLTHLSLDAAELGPSFPGVLVDGAAVIPLEHLSINDVALGDAGMDDLIEISMGELSDLQELRATHNGITDGGLSGIGSSATFPSMRKLDLRWNRLTWQGADRFSSRRSWRCLEVAELEGNEIQVARLQRLSFKRS